MAVEAIREDESATVKQLIREVGKDTNVHTIFGEPELLEGKAVIPVAQVKYGGGGGFGSGHGPGEEEEAEAGRGGGVGFGVQAKPMGTVEVTADTIRWRPIVDWSKLAVVWSVISGILVVMLVGTLVGKRQ